MDIYYFAFGMLTSPNIMSEDAIHEGAAILHNHSLEFRYFANALEGGDSMYGVLWSIDEDILDDLDFMEGVPTLYTRKQVPVFSKDLGMVTAWVYSMTDGTRERLKGQYPSDSYLDTMVYGYEIAGIPTKEIGMALAGIDKEQDR